MCPTGTGSGDIPLLVAADRSQPTLRNVPARARSLERSAPMAWRKEKNEMHEEEQEKYLRSCQPERTLCNPNNIDTTQRLPATGDPPSVATDSLGGAPMPINRPDQWCP